MAEEIKVTPEEPIKEEKVEPKKEIKPTVAPKNLDLKKWRARKLKDINNMSDKVKAKALAERVLKNK